MTGLYLGFDTSAAHCAAALLWVRPEGSRTAVVAEPMAKGQAERLLPMIEGLMAAQGVTFADLAAVCVGTGPGNFTGIRIAVSLARGMALSLNVPAIGVTGFDAARQAAGLAQPHWALIDAPRGQVYAQKFGPDATPPQIVPTETAFDAPVVRWSDLAADAIAVAVAQAGARLARDPQPRPAPFYLRSADAAPPSDPPPAILP